MDIRNITEPNFTN